jgi:Carboxypeptidase regulatory-like domain/Bacterial Ig-like domain (group 2)
MRARSLLIAIAVAAGFVACGGDSGPGPTQPTVPTLFGPPTSIQITGNLNLTSVGQQSQLTATATFANGQTRNVSRQAQWEVTNPAVATISSTGLLRMTALGETQVTATFRNVKSTAVTASAKQPAAVTGLTITGPARLAPGATEQFTATAQYSDGTTGDVSARANWFVYPTTVLQHAGGGRFHANAPGDAFVSAYFSPRGASFQALVLPPDTFKLSGTVKDISGGQENILVEVLSGTGAGLKAKSDSAGKYALYGVAGTVQLRVSAAGYDTQEATVDVNNNAERDFTLNTTSQPVDVAGTWTLVFRTSSACSSSWPQVVREREIPTTMTQQGTRLTFRFTGPSIQSSFSNYSSGRIAGKDFLMTLSFDDYYRLYGIMDRPTPTDWVGIYGTAEGVATSPTLISGSFAGTFDYYTSTANSNFPQGFARSCAADPAFELRR